MSSAAWFDISTPDALRARRFSPYTGLVAYFPVDDVDAALARAERLGATRILSPTDTPASRIAVFTDLDGNHVGLISR
ncbi:VOC family protein [Streptomyces sp. NPDC001307]|uniref:VOC family protein n=1 Tax=Streptomyces sp. NPDC001307 TaxID=3364560 RepID=UPI00367AAB1F